MHRAGPAPRRSIVSASISWWLVELGQVARLAEAAATPRQAIGTPWTPARKRERVRMAVEHGDDRARLAGTARRGSTVAPSPSPARAWKRAEEQVGAREADDLGVAARAAAAIASGTSAPITATVDAASRRAGGSRRPARGALARRASDRPAPGRSAAWRGGSTPRCRPGDRAAPRACRNVHSKSCPKAGSQATQPGCSMPIDGRDDRLVGAALGPQRHAARRADEDRLPAGVDAERPRLERARDERVVDGADRQQRLARRATTSPRARRAGRRG